MTRTIRLPLPSIASAVRAIEARESRERATPLVIYPRDPKMRSFGTCHLAQVHDYLHVVSGYTADEDTRLRRVRVPTAAGLAAIEAAQEAERAAHRAALKVYAEAYRDGTPIDPDAARKARI